VRGLDRQLLLLRLYALLTYPFACVPFLYFYFVGQGLDLAGYGLVVGIYYVAMFVAEVPTGMIADRLGRKAMMVLGPFLLAAGFLVLVLWPGMAGFCCGEALLGIGHSVLSGPPAALLYDSLRAHGQETRYLQVESRVNAWRLLGTGGSFLAGGLVAWALAEGTAWAWSETIVLTSLLCCLAGVLATGLEEAPRPRTTRAELLQQGMRDLNQPAVRWLVFYWVVLFALLRYPFHNYQVYLGRIGEENPTFAHPLTIGTVYLALNLLAAPMSRSAPRLVQRLGRRTLFWAMPLSLGLSLLAMAPGIGTLGVVMFAFQQLPFGIHMPVMQEFVNHRIATTARTTVLSALSLAGRLCYAGINVALFQVQATAGEGTAYAIAGSVGIVATVLVMWVRPRGLLRGEGNVS